VSALGTERSAAVTANVVGQAVVNGQVGRSLPQLPGINPTPGWATAAVDHQASACVPADDMRPVPQPSVLAIFAHPDDAELACFGSLAALVASGYKAHIVALTNGSTSVSNMSQLRPSEAKEAADLINADLTIEKFADGGLMPNSTLHACVSTHLSRISPTILFTHCPGVDYHQDHEVTGRIVTAAAMRQTAIRLVLQAEPPIFVGSFSPNLYSDVTANIETKLQAVHHYTSEAGKWFMTDQAILERAAWWARQAEPTDPKNPRYCEAFRVAKALVNVADDQWELAAEVSRKGSPSIARPV
jgi:N-acetylglucosamine malate deacetylase 1